MLIIGLDAGITKAYAIFDLNGNLLECYSAKHLAVPSIISACIAKGKPVIVASDVNPAPALVKKIATLLGAKLIIPNKTLSVYKKQQLAKYYNPKNKHETDAIASALYALKSIRKLLRLIDVRLKKKHKQEYNAQVKYLLLTKKHLNIERALKLV